jgi:hypothetical protein
MCVSFCAKTPGLGFYATSALGCSSAICSPDYRAGGRKPSGRHSFNLAVFGYLKKQWVCFSGRTIIE